jgi:hypothetical protein
MKSRLLVIASSSEVATGIVLLVYPPIVIKLLFGAEIIGAGLVLSRIAGIALIGLGVACWPPAGASRAILGLLSYSALAMLYLWYLGIAGNFAGILLWPAVVVHAVLTGLLVWAWFKPQENE